MRIGETAAAALEGVIERAENSATAQHIRNRSFDSLPGLAAAGKEALPGQSPLGRAPRESGSAAAPALDRAAQSSQSGPQLTKSESGTSDIFDAGAERKRNKPPAR